MTGAVLQQWSDECHQGKEGRQDWGRDREKEMGKWEGAVELRLNDSSEWWKNGGNSKLQHLLKLKKKSHWERLPIFNELYWLMKTIPSISQCQYPKHKHWFGLAHRHTTSFVAINMSTDCSAVGWPAQHLCLDVTPHFCPCTLRIKWSWKEENSPWLWAQKSACYVKHIKQYVLQRATKFIVPCNIMEFKSWRCTKIKWIQPQATLFEFEVNLALWTRQKTSKTSHKTF